MNFHEKSAWACFGAILMVFTPYFVTVFREPMAYVGLFVAAVIALVVILTTFHIINAIVSPGIRQSGDTPPADELDRVIEHRAAKLSGLILGLTVVCWTMSALIGLPTGGMQALTQQEANPAQWMIPVVDVTLWVHALFAGFVLANLVYYGAIVTQYRWLG